MSDLDRIIEEMNYARDNLDAREGASPLDSVIMGSTDEVNSAIDSNIRDNDVRRMERAEDTGIGFFGGLFNNVLDDPNSTRYVTRPVYNIINELDSIATGNDYKWLPMDEPLIDNRDLSPSGRAGRDSGRALGGGLAVAGALGTTGRLLNRSVSPSNRSINPVDLIMRARSAKKTVPASIRPPTETLGGSAPEWALRLADDVYRNPGTEYTAILGSAQLAGAASYAFDGNPAAVAAGEMIGGVLNPAIISGRLISGVSTNLRDALTGVKNVVAEQFNMGSPSYQGAVEAIRRTAQEMAKERGLDPDTAVTALINQLDDAVRELPEGVTGLTAGQLTNHPALVAMENRLALMSREYRGKTESNTQQGLQTLRGLADALVLTGNPIDYQLSGQIRKQYMEQLVSSSMEEARLDVIRAVSNVELRGLRNPDDAENIAGEASQNVVTALRENLAISRTNESELWSAIPSDVDMTAYGDSVLPAMRSVDERLGNTTNPIIERGRRLLNTSDGEGVTSGDWTAFIRDAGRAAQNARSGDNPDLNLAGSLEELRQGFITAFVESDTVSGIAYENARAYSTALNDVFRRKFAGQALEQRRSGAPRIRPEQVLDRAFGADTAPTRRLQMEELRAADTFGNEAAESIAQRRGEEGTLTKNDILSNIYGLDPVLGTSIFSEQETFLKTIVRRHTNEDGTIDHDGLVKFVDENATMFESFPELQRNLGDVRQAANYLQQVERRSDYVNDIILSKSVWARVSAAENPVSIVRHAMGGANLLENLRNMARTARDADRVAARMGNPSVNSDAAKEGLKYSLFTYAINRADGSRGAFWENFNNILNAPVPQGSGERGRSILEEMRVQGLVSREQMDNLDQLISIGVRVERAIDDPTVVDDVFEEGGATSVAEQGLISIIGARAMSSLVDTISPGTPTAGSSLIIASRGAQLARNIFSDSPTEKNMEMLMYLSQNPALMRDMLKKTDDPDVLREYSNSVHAYLISSGFGGFTDERATGLPTDLPALWEEEDARNEPGPEGSLNFDDIESMLSELDTGVEY